MNVCWWNDEEHKRVSEGERDTESEQREKSAEIIWKCVNELQKLINNARIAFSFFCFDSSCKYIMFDCLPKKTERFGDGVRVWISWSEHNLQALPRENIRNCSATTKSHTYTHTRNQMSKKKSNLLFFLLQLFLSSCFLVRFYFYLFVRQRQPAAAMSFFSSSSSWRDLIRFYTIKCVHNLFSICEKRHIYNTNKASEIKTLKRDEKTIYKFNTKT